SLALAGLVARLPLPRHEIANRLARPNHPLGLLTYHAPPTRPSPSGSLRPWLLTEQEEEAGEIRGNQLTKVANRPGLRRIVVQRVGCCDPVYVTALTFLAPPAWTRSPRSDG